MRKRLLALVCVILFVFGLSGCFTAKEKTFEVAGMRIVLTDDFAEKEYITYTSYYVSQDMVVITLKEDKATFSQAGISFANTDLMEYAGMVIRANGLTVKPNQDEKFTSFVYDKTVSGKDYTYHAFVYKAADAFWLIQFATLQKDYEEKIEDIFKYAGTVTFVNETPSPEIV